MTAKKFDQAKVRMDLLPVVGVWYTAMVMTHGAIKYGEFNYLEGGGLSWGRLIGASLRHIWSILRGEWTDSESGLPHAAHAAANMLMLIETRTLSGEDKNTTLYQQYPGSLPNYVPVAAPEKDSQTKSPKGIANG